MKVKELGTSDFWSTKKMCVNLNYMSGPSLGPTRGVPNYASSTDKINNTFLIKVIEKHLSQSSLFKKFLKKRNKRNIYSSPLLLLSLTLLI